MASGVKITELPAGVLAGGELVAAVQGGVTKKAQISAVPTGSVDNAILRANGTGGFTAQNSAVQIDDSGNIAPVTTDVGALGTSLLQWSDAFLASGAVINFAAGDVLITHSTNALAFTGASSGYSFDASLLLASGTAINWNAGDVTITHAANTLTFAGAASGYQFADGPIQPVANDGVALGVSGTAFSDLFLASGGIVNWAAGDVLITHSTNSLAFSGASSGYSFDAVVLPSANDAAPLGSATVSWADLFLATGGVINWANGDVTITHSANLLAFAGATGGYTFDVPINLASGGTGSSLTDPGADRIMGWDETPANATIWFTPTNGVETSGTDLQLAAGRRNIADITAGDTIVATDRNKLVNIASGTGTLAFTAAATLGSTFVVDIKNTGTGNVTLDPNSAELIDGLATWVLYPGGTIRVYCDGSGFFSELLAPMTVTFNASGTFTTPGVGTYVDGLIWGGGGGGARGTTSVAGGGGGGAGCTPFSIPRSSLTATVTVTIGAGGAVQTGASTNGNPGNNSTFGAFATGYAGGGGSGSTNTVAAGGGGGGGALGSGTTATSTAGGIAGAPINSSSVLDNPGFGGGYGSSTTFGTSVGGACYYGGGGGGGGDTAPGQAGGASAYGGGGGGGGGDATAGGAGGVSTYGGSGGAGNTGNTIASNGTQPGGGGGGSETANSGAGADGRLTLRIS